jgi:hypothetical protein
MLNKSMNKKKEKDKLTQSQYQILRKQDKDVLTTEKWIKDTGLTVCVFNRMPVQVLKAQQVAHTLLTHNLKLLTTEQIKTIHAFQRKVGNTKNHKNLKPSTAYPILNINNKINRLLFKQHKQHSKTSASTTTI